MRAEIWHSMPVGDNVGSYANGNIPSFPLYDHPRMFYENILKCHFCFGNVDDSFFHSHTQSLTHTHAHTRQAEHMPHCQSIWYFQFCVILNYAQKMEQILINDIVCYTKPLPAKYLLALAISALSLSCAPSEERPEYIEELIVYIKPDESKFCQLCSSLNYFSTTNATTYTKITDAKVSLRSTWIGTPTKHEQHKDAFATAQPSS